MCVCARVHTHTFSFSPLFSLSLTHTQSLRKDVEKQGSEMSSHHMTQKSLLGIHTEETRSERDTCTPMFIAALFIIARTWKQPRCPSADEWIRNLWYIYIMEYYSAIKKNTYESVLMRWMKLDPIIQSEVSQKDKDQYSILTHIYGIYKDGNDNPICKTEKETQMYRTDFWTLWEKARVG